MKTKGITATIFVLLVAAFFLLAGPLQYNLQKQVTVNASLYDISVQFTDLQNWPAWYPGFAASNPSSLQYTSVTNGILSSVKWPSNNELLITAVNPAGIVIKETIHGKTHYLAVTGTPVDEGRKTIITYTKKITGWEWLKENVFAAGNMSRGLEALKKITEVSAMEYGFPIQVEPVTDTLILTGKRIVLKKESLAQQHLLYKELLQLMQQENITASRNYIFTSSLPVGSADSISIAIGIPVAKKENSDAEHKFLALPAAGRLLTGTYQGTYGQRKNLYTAMNRYLVNNGMKTAAQPMEQHNHFSALQNDSVQVNIKIIYPIY